MIARFFQRATSQPDSWQLQIDIQEAERRKRERIVRLNTVTVPALRASGFALLSLTVLIYNYSVHAVDGGVMSRLILTFAVYCAVSTCLLQLCFEDLRKYFDLGVTFLIVDLVFWQLAVYATGAEQSWLFVIPLFRVVDQTPISTRRALLFAHLAPVSYAALLAYVIVVEGRQVAAGPEWGKLAFMYIGSIYAALVARSADRRTHRMAQVIRLARQLITELEQKSAALETSSREVRESFDRQSRLANENAMLYASAQRDRARQQQIFNSTSDGIIFVRRDGCIEAANVRAGDLLDFEPSAVIGVELATLVSRLYSVGDGDSFLPMLHRLLEDPWAGGSGDLQQPATGRVFHWVAQPARDLAGDVSGLTFTVQDVTRPRDLVRQLEDKSKLLADASAKSEDANRAKGEFLANVSHEIRTPLSAIIGMSQHMLDNGATDAMVRRIRSAAESLMSVINDILDFSKIDSRKLTLDVHPFSLREVLAGAVDTLQVRADEKQLALKVEVARDVTDRLLGDALRLRQILINLLGNALKFTERGEVCLRVNVASASADEICLHFGVRDTGIGIPRDKQAIVFDAFSQADGSAARKYGGTGLGLSISTRLVEMMRGDLWVESEAGEGSTFRFTATFGVQQTDGVEIHHLADGSPLPIGPMTMLVVEDEDVHRELLVALLRARGHRAIPARNGRDALQELARAHVDIVLMDLQMPEMDGVRAAATIRAWERAVGGHLPIVAMTASALDDDQARCRDAGMDRFITKPIARDALFRAVEELSTQSCPAEMPPELAGRPAFLSGLGDDVELARKLVDIFLEQSPALMSRVREAIEAEDAGALHRAAHALKGTISNFPAGPARSVAARMETLGRDGDVAGARETLPMLERELDRFRALLPMLINAEPSGGHAAEPVPAPAP
jgi:signal transduction histidine kinase/HPt (histidine-containing phosphotransfer) domain-containing protein/ActR/RegA family two-component response regulator